MRGIWVWIGMIAVGLATLLVVMALVGNSDRSDETVSAAEWAEGVCGSVGVWRGEMEAIVEDIRTPPSVGSSSQEPQSETPQGRTGFIREGLERAERATATLVTGIDNAGQPDTESGDQAANALATWADAAYRDLQEAQSALDTEADSLEASLDQVTGAVKAFTTALLGGRQAFVDAAQADPEIAAAFAASASCQQLREEQSS